MKLDGPIVDLEQQPDGHWIARCSIPGLVEELHRDTRAEATEAALMWIAEHDGDER